MSGARSIGGQLLRALWKLCLLMLWTLLRLTEVFAAALGNMVKEWIK